MLKITDLTFARGQQRLFEQLNLAVHAGQKAAIVGRNGAGKSTLFELILGRLQPDTGTIDLPRDWRISHLAQDIEVSQRPALEYVIDGHTALRTAERQLARAEAAGDHMGAAHRLTELQDLGVYESRARAGEILYGLGFSAGDEDRPFAQFSGGWRVRLGLARALFQPADLLLLDEPTNHLDLEATVWLENWLARFAGTLLVIAHDRAFLDNIAELTVHLSGGTAHTYRGGYSEFERQRALAMIQQQAGYERQQREIAHIQAFVDRFRAKASKARQAQSRLKALERMERVAPVYAELPYRVTVESPDRMSTPLLSLDHADIGYDGETVLRDVHQSLLPGDRIGVLGANGAGKSTLLKCLVGNLHPLNGRRVEGRNLAIGYFAQHQLELLDAENTALKCVQDTRPEWPQQQCRDFLGGWGFDQDKSERAISTLSGGEKARLVLALIACERPALLVLDEPTNHLDLDMRDALALALQAYDGAVVVVAHDRSLLERTVDDYWLVENGRVARLRGDLDTYLSTHSQALRGAAAVAGSPGIADTEPRTPLRATDTARAGASAAERRRIAAARRRREKPLRDELARLETEIGRLAGELETLEARLADTDTYQSLPAAELDALLSRAGRLRAERDALEERWLTRAEALESLDAESD